MSGEGTRNTRESRETRRTRNSRDTREYRRNRKRAINKRRLGSAKDVDCQTPGYVLSDYVRCTIYLVIGVIVPNGANVENCIVG